MAANPDDASPARPDNPPARSDALIGAVAVGLAVVAGMAAHLGAPKAQSLVGIIVILAVVYAASVNRRAIDRRTVAWGSAFR